MNPLNSMKPSLPPTPQSTDGPFLNEPVSWQPGTNQHARSLSVVTTVWGVTNPTHSQVFGAPMGPGESSGGHIMPVGSPGMGGSMGSQFIGQQSYGDGVSKGYGQPVMYGRPSAAYNPASAYGGSYSGNGGGAGLGVRAPSDFTQAAAAAVAAAAATATATATATVAAIQEKQNQELSYGQRNPPHSSQGSGDAPGGVALHVDRQWTVSCTVGLADDIHNPVGETSRKGAIQPGTTIAQEKLV
ncbi:hypothetical protein ILYODFUR_015599 [Ilyodon furcidens]|uniref:Uncharacterized protein n=2 Tax=Goodeidae TaxID=28758 RepID=A0ABV0TLV9_9TELE